MSQKYPGGFITKTPTAPTSSAAPGIWTLDQAMQNQKAGNWPSPPSPYIEDWFSTYLYSGSASTQTITNNINLSGKGGLVWLKIRNDSLNNILFDTARGDFELISNSTAAQANNSRGFVPLSTGFSLNGGENVTNNTPNTYVSWTFAERQKFFDIVTYTGNGTAGTAIPHNLGSVPGCILVKKTSGTDAWAVYHRGVNSGTGNGLLVLNTTAAQNTNGRFWWGDNTNFIAPTSTNFTVSNDGQVNASGATYVAYLFAHDAGGFGLTGSDNVITCGSVTTDGSGVGNVTLGYEPQWILTKQTGTTGAWRINDSMRGLSVTSGADLRPNVSDAEASYGAASYVTPNATGFSINSLFGTNQPVIYIAIRRGPMKVPTLGTTVYNAIARSGTGAAATVTGVGFPPDSVWPCVRNNPGNGTFIYDRLRGANASLNTPSTGAENTGTTTALTAFGMDGFTLGSNNIVNESGSTFINWCFQRAPSFFDEVCYTGTGSATTVTHNLGVAPELMIVKSRSNGALGWYVYSTGLGPTKCNLLNQTNGQFTSSTYWNDTAPTSSVFTLGSGGTNGSGNTQVAYLFATCPGVSKVGSYTGNGSSQTINCGFTTGSRFVLIKRTDTTGDWYVWDSARGIVAGNDPYLLLNSTAAEVTGTDAVDTDSTGFIVNRLVAVDVNENAGTYIFLAIA